MGYGPKLTFKQLQKLRAEIAAFKADKDAEPELRAEIEKAACGGKDIDAYQKWVDENGGREPLEANPDQLTDDCPSPWGRPQAVDTTGLSELEKDVWALYREAGYSQEDIADQLAVTRKAVEMALRRATRKLKGQL